MLSLQDLITKVRVELTEGYVLDMYHNETLGKYSYTLVKQNRRIVGWDNAPHHPSQTNFPHHFHAENGLIEPSTFTGDPRQDIVQVVEVVNAILGR